MRHISTIRTVSVLLAVFLLALSGCASTTPYAYQDLESSSYLQPDFENDHVPFEYSTQTDWRKYRNIIIKPVTIYEGWDNGFGDLSKEDKFELANYMRITFADTLRTRFRLVHDPSPDTLVLKLTLTGADTNTPVLSTLAHFDITGGLYNTFQAVTDGEGAFTGNVIYVVEIFDSTTDRLLSAYISKQYPNAWNLGAGFGGLSAAETGLDKGAEALLEQLK